MTGLRKVFLGGLILILIAAATIRFGYAIMLAMLIGATLVIFAVVEDYKRWETQSWVTPHEKRILDESRRRVKKRPWENVD